MTWAILGGIVGALVVLFAWPPTPSALRRLVKRLHGLAKVLPHARRNRTDLLRFLVRRPSILAAVNVYESAIIACNGVEPRVKYLATLKASSLAGCPF